MTIRLRGDFMGVFGDLLCISHGDTAPDEEGNQIALSEGMQVVVVEDDSDNEGPAEIIAAGTVERTPEGTCGSGSRWALRIDARGVRREARANSVE